MPANPLVRYIVQWGNTPLCEEKVSIGYGMTSYLLNCKELHCLQYSTNAAFSSNLKAPWPDINTNRKWNYCISSTCSGHIQSYSLIRWRHWHSLLNHRTLLIRAKIAQQQQQQQQVKPSKQWNKKKQRETGLSIRGSSLSAHWKRGSQQGVPEKAALCCYWMY